MPLLKGSSDNIVSSNIREMRKAGHPEAQAVAASLRNAGRAKKSAEGASKLTSMKDVAGKSSEVASSPSAKEDYPYGLRMELNDHSLNKLGIDQLPDVGSEMHFHVRGKVANVSSHQGNEDASARKSVSVQITHMKHMKGA